MKHCARSITRRFVATWHEFSRANAVCRFSDGCHGAYCRGVEYPRPFMRQNQPRSPPDTLLPVCLDPAATRREAIERLYVRRILTQLCLQNSISCVGKAEIKADINPLTISSLLFTVTDLRTWKVYLGYWEVNAISSNITVSFLCFKYYCI